MLEEGELRPGGETTVDVTDTGAFLQQAANLSLARRTDFESGFQFFSLDWEVAPGRPEADGVGPLLNAISCLGCHDRNGRGLPGSNPARPGVGVLLRLGVGDEGRPDPVYGNQLQPTGIAGVAGEGVVTRRDETVLHQLVDGSTRELEIPVYGIEDPGYGPLADDLRLSPRLTPHLVGQGLLEAIPADDILAGSDPDDADGDGISGRPAWVQSEGERALGRFGWKAGQPSVEAQTAIAYHEDLGITSRLHPDVNCPSVQSACDSATNGGSPEITAARLAVTAAYLRLLGVPVRRNGDDPDVLRGKTLFQQSGCASCHRPSFVTAAETHEPELASQRIWPYSDGLLHDMGSGLSDRRPEGEAQASEWRTPPLWSLGLVETVGARAAFLHDGRATTIDEAILWHGGEATEARLAYERMPEARRKLLVQFVESL